MADCHDHPACRGRGDLELVGHRCGIDCQRVVSRRSERRWQSREHADPLVVNERRLSVQQLGGSIDNPAVSNTDRLQTQADAEDRQTAGPGLDDLHADAGFLRRTWSWREQYPVKAGGKPWIAESRVIVSPDIDVGANLSKILHQVVNEGVVVVDHQDLRSRHGPILWADGESAKNGSRWA